MELTDFVSAISCRTGLLSSWCSAINITPCGVLSRDSILQKPRLSVDMMRSLKLTVFTGLNVSDPLLSPAKY